MKDLEPGRYRLSAERNGYLRQEYGMRGQNTSGTILSFSRRAGNAHRCRIQIDALAVIARTYRKRRLRAASRCSHSRCTNTLIKKESGD